MVVPLMKWSRSPPLPPAMRKFQVKVKLLRLEGFDHNHEGNEEKKEKVISIKIKWEGERKFGLMPFHRKSKQNKEFSREKTVKKGESIEWEEDFEKTCCFIVDGKDHQKFAPWDVSFSILYGDKTDSKANKMVVIGRVTADIGEVASKMAAEVERKLPINLHVGGVAREATLVILLSFVEMRDNQDSSSSTAATSHGSTNSAMLGDSVESNTFSQKGEGGASQMVKSRSLSSQETTQSNSVKKMGFFSWKRRRLSFNKTVTERSKEGVWSEKMGFNTNKINADNLSPAQKQDPSGASSGCNTQNEEAINVDAWETKELTSRDGKTKLKTSVFFASFDQRSDKAAGESACSVLASVISHFLQSNNRAMPTRLEFDSLIIDGSAEWRKLCATNAYADEFPNKHFDLETVVRAAIRPLAISHNQSYIAFFGPEKFESLKGVRSFDEIWDEIGKDIQVYEHKVYIVSWNDHFFVLKVEENAIYLIDTLGERLFEGCTQAYILKFTDLAVMHGTVENRKGEGEDNQDMGEGDEEEVLICSGKECCKEFMKRFLAAIPLKELEEEEEKNTVSYFSLHHRLQIEFNFIYPLSPLSSSTSSPFSSSATATSSPLYV